MGDEGIKCEYLEDIGEYILLNGQHPLPKTVFAKYRFKTVSMAIAEMQYAMTLTGIQYGLFCPDMDGSIGWQVWAEDPDLYDPPFSDLRVSESTIADIRNDFPAYPLEGFRKPQNGMLVLASFCIAGPPDEWEQRLMIGDRPEDEAAAQAAGFDFMWADDWRKQMSLQK